MSEPRHLTAAELASWKRVYERSGDRVSMHREFALALIATAVRDADTLHQARQLAEQVREMQCLDRRREAIALADDLLTLLATPPPDTGAEPKCICPRFSDTGGFRLADLGCPVHGVDGTNPGDGYWEDEPVPDTGAEP